MVSCDKIIKALNSIMRKCFIFPIILIGSPIFFILAGKDGCGQAKKETKEFLKFVWTGDF